MTEPERKTEDQDLEEMMKKVRAIPRRVSSAIAWAVFIAASFGALYTSWLFIMLTLASGKNFSGPAQSLFEVWGLFFVIGTLVLVPATLVLAIVSIFRPLRSAYLWSAGALVVFWPIAMNVLRVILYRMSGY